VAPPPNSFDFSRRRAAPDRSVPAAEAAIKAGEDQAREYLERLRDAEAFAELDLATELAVPSGI
jgi:hypothetical protein